MNAVPKYVLVWILYLLSTSVVDAQHFPKGFSELNANVGFGSKITQSNLYYGCNLALAKRSRFYFTTGVRLAATHNIRPYTLSTPHQYTPVLYLNDEGVWCYSLNIALGLNCAITEYLYVGISAEVLGMSAMSKMTGSITTKTDSTTFENSPTSTNMVVNPSSAGNLQNQLLVNFRLNERLFFNLILANQRSQVDFLSSLTDYGTFSLTDNAYFVMLGLQWRFEPKRKAH